MALGMPRDADSFYVEDCRQVQTNTHSIQTLTGQVSRLVGTLDAEKDIQHCRKMVDEAVRQASETRVILARIREHQHQAQNPGERNNRRMMYNKLSDNLSITARVLEDVVRRFTQEERKHIASLDDCAVAPQGGLGMGGAVQTFNMAAGDEAAGEEQSLIDCSSRTGASSSACLADAGALDRELKQEKCNALRRVDEDMRCLQRIYTDLASAAEEQQASFDTLESHMASAAIDIERGREEISRTKYAWSRVVKSRIVKVTAGLVGVFVVGSYMLG